MARAAVGPISLRSARDPAHNQEAVRVLLQVRFGLRAVSKAGL
jgi:hypothetical protein